MFAGRFDTNRHRALSFHNYVVYSKNRILTANTQLLYENYINTNQPVIIAHAARAVLCLANVSNRTGNKLRPCTVRAHQTGSHLTSNSKFIRCNEYPTPHKI